MFTVMDNSITNEWQKGMSYTVNTHLADNHYICTPGNHAETNSLYRFLHNLLS